MKMLKPICFLFCLVLSFESVASDDSLASNTYKRYVDTKGDIYLPRDFRLTWSHIGSWFVLDEKAPGHGLHDVYMQEEAVKHYRNTGSFADGSVLIKEIRHLGSGIKTTGKAYWGEDEKIWFVMVKDSRQRFDSKHWRQGWGWALFDAKNPAQNISESFEKTCQGCHLPAKDKDWVFTEGYPTLKAKNHM